MYCIDIMQGEAVEMEDVNCIKFLACQGHIAWLSFTGGPNVTSWRTFTSLKVGLSTKEKLA